MEIGNVELYVLRDAEAQYEAVVIQFSDHSELLRVIDSNALQEGRRANVDKAGVEWMKVHSALSKALILRGKVYDLIENARSKKK
jgi:hypothetical protein